MLRKKESIFLERASMENAAIPNADLSHGYIEEVIECMECDKMFVVIYISRVSEESGEHHHVALQNKKEDIFACPYCGKK